MSDTFSEGSLLAQLDAQQDEVLQKLDELNERIEQVLQDCAQNRQTEEAVEN